MRVPDRILTGNGRGDVYEVFNPRWYRVDRWLWWLGKLVFDRRRPRCVITFHTADGEQHLRAIKSDQKLPSVTAWPTDEKTPTNQS